jgi:hypothetical protein
MTIVTRLVRIAVAAACLCSFASAQVPLSTTDAVVPRLVNFSGKAVDIQGKVLSGVAGVTFAIYKDQDGGSPLWLESQNVQADAKGNYTAQLGATKPNGLPLDLFTSGEARWLGVTVNGGQEQSRVLLLSVPYALKAADADTVGGLPASAFMLAAPPTSGASREPASESAGSLMTGTVATQPSVPGSTPVTTAGGSTGKIPLWDTSTDIASSIITQTGSGSGAKLGINIANPLFTLDVKGTELVRGLFEMATTGFATASKSFSSNPLNLESSAFNSTTGTYALNHFQWQAEPVGNNTSNPGATLNLLYGTDPNPLTETGLKIASTGQITFANGQVFPGTGTISGVTAGTDLLGGGTTGNVTLKLDTTKVPQLGTSNNFLGNQNVTGNVGVIGNVGVGIAIPGATFDVFSSTAGVHAPMARFGSNGFNDANSIVTYTASGVAEVFQSGCDNCFVPGVQVGDGGLRVNPGKNIVFGDSGSARLKLDSTGNASQPRAANGMVKAIIKFIAHPPIVSCFNSTLTGAAATKPPCGFTVDETGIGDYIFDLGFQVNDRFFSVTEYDDPIDGIPDTTTVCVFGCVHTLGPNEVEVTARQGGNFYFGAFDLIVY